MSNEERVARSQVVIDTDCALAETEKQVNEEWQRLQERLATPSAGRGV
jgi:dephospho-CoA kinase